MSLIIMFSPPAPAVVPRPQAPSSGHWRPDETLHRRSFRWRAACVMLEPPGGSRGAHITYRYKNPTAVHARQRANRLMDQQNTADRQLP